MQGGSIYARSKDPLIRGYMQNIVEEYYINALLTERSVPYAR